MRPDPRLRGLGAPVVGSNPTPAADSLNRENTMFNQVGRMLMRAGNKLALALQTPDAKALRKQEQSKWNRDPATFSEWRKKQRDKRPSSPAPYLNKVYAERAHVRFIRARNAMVQKGSIDGTPQFVLRFPTYESMPSHILRNASR
jgi:hypothetical protein